MAPQAQSGVGYLGIEWIVCGGGGGRDDSLQTAAAAAADDCGAGYILERSDGRARAGGLQVFHAVRPSVHEGAPLYTTGRHSDGWKSNRKMIQVKFAQTAEADGGDPSCRARGLPVRRRLRLVASWLREGKEGKRRLLRDVDDGCCWWSWRWLWLEKNKGGGKRKQGVGCRGKDNAQPRHKYDLDLVSCSCREKMNCPLPSSIQNTIIVHVAFPRQ